MKIEIDCLAYIPYDIQCAIVEYYCSKYQYVEKKQSHLSNIIECDFQLKETGKTPIKIKIDKTNKHYWLKCIKFKMTYKIEIWYAS